MLIGPLASKRREEISIFRRLSPDDTSKYSRILPKKESPNTFLGDDDTPQDGYIKIGDDFKINSVSAIVIPLLREDTILPGGPVNADPQFAAYIDQPREKADIRVGDLVMRRKIGAPKDEKEPQLFVIGYYEGEISDRLDLIQQGGVTGVI